MKTILISLTALLLCSGPVLAQNYRDELPRSSVQINRALLTHARGYRFKSVKTLLPIYAPLMKAFKMRFGQDVKADLDAALASQNGPALLHASQRLVFLDTMDFLEIARSSWEKSPDKAAFSIRSARYNYSLLSPFIKDIDPGSNKILLALFREISQELDSGGKDKRGSIMEKLLLELKAGFRKLG